MEQFKSKTSSKKTVILVLSVLVSFAVVLVLLISLVKSLLPHQPVHFKGLDYDSTRNDTIRLYGEPDEVKEFSYPKGRFYDYYEKTFLGVKGDLQVSYIGDSEYISNVRFIIDSKDYESISEYEKAVEKTYKHFNKNLPATVKKDLGEDGGVDISWSFDKYGYAYSIYDTEIFPESGIITSEDDLSEGMIFQFNTYRLSAE